MRSEKLTEAVGLVDDELLEEAADVGALKKKKTMPRILRWTAAAACLCLAVLGGMKLAGPKKPEAPDGPVWPTRIVRETGGTQQEIAVIPHWEDMDLPQRYSSFTLDGREYSLSGSTAEFSAKGELLGKVVMSGYDIYADKEHSIDASVFTMRETDPTLALLLQFDGDETLYACLNWWYAPETLADFIRAFRLEERLQITACTLSLKQAETGRRRYVLLDADGDEIWQLLTEDTSLKNQEYDDFADYDRALSFAVSVSGFGIENKSLKLMDNGWLTTNVGETRKAFFLGEEKARAILDHAAESYEGVELVYEDVLAGTEEMLPENAEFEFPKEIVVMTTVSP